jgi:hypothetical protein
MNRLRYGCSRTSDDGNSYPKLTRLFSDGQVVKGDIKLIARTIRENPDITTLDIGNRDCKKMSPNLEDEWVYLADELRVNTNVTRIHMEMHHISPMTAALIASVLTTNTTLKELFISGSTWDCTCIADALATNTTLTNLSLRDNSIDHAAIAHAIKKNTNTKLKTLSISQSKRGLSLSDAEAASICDMLKNNTTITVVYLDFCNIGDKGAVRIASMLKVNTKIVVLSASQNLIGQLGAMSIAEALRKNSSLDILRIDINDIGRAGLAAMCSALGDNTTLTKIVVGPSYDMTEDEQLTMFKFVKNNDRLKFQHDK